MYRQWIVCVAVFCAAMASASAAMAQPDLRPTASLLARGVVSVRNTGNSAAPSSILTIACHRPGRDIDRIAIPSQFRASYTSADFPGRIVVEIPALAPGAVFNHALPFWAAMMWPQHTTFHFDFAVDVNEDVAEGAAGEANNADTYVKIVP